MYRVANCLVSVLRGTTTNEFGDVVDTNAVHQSGITAAFYEDAQTVSDPSSQTPRIIRTHVCRVPSNTDVNVDDRIQNDTFGGVYSVEDVIAQTGVGRTHDLVLSLRRVTA